MKFGMNPSPYYRSKRSTTQIMLELFIGLCAVWVCAIVYYFITGTANGVRALLNPIVAMVCCMATEVLFMLPRHVKEKASFKSLCLKVLNSYGYITGIILALLLPVATSWYVIVLSSIFSIAVGKMVFGGFGHNIFNPAVLGRIFAQTAFFSKLSYDTQISTGATITTQMGQYGWSLDIIGSGNISLLDTLLGNYRGTLGETFTLVILAVGIILALRKVIDWRAPVFYLGAIYVATFFMGLCGGYGLDSFEYALVQISIGGVMFGAVFCITDPVTSPTSPSGRITFGIGAAIITMLIRYLGSAPEGVAYSILLMNMLTPLIDSSVKGLSNQFTRKKIITTCVLSALSIGAGCLVGATKIDKVEYLNHRFNTSDNPMQLTATVKKLEDKENGDEVYNVSVAGNFGQNEAFTYSNFKETFKADIDKMLEKYSNSETYPELTWTFEKNTVYANYKSGEKTKKETALVVSVALDSKNINADESKNWVIKVRGNNDVTLATGYTNKDYKGSYGIEIDENYNVTVTFASDHSTRDETNLSYSSVDFDVTLNWENQTVTGTKLNSSGAGGGVGDAMLDLKTETNQDGVEFTIGEYTISEENAKKAEAFYHKYIEISSPVAFSEYQAYQNGVLNVTKDVENYEIVKVGATYTANGYMFAINRVIEYATAYHQSLNAGKVGL